MSRRGATQPTQTQADEFNLTQAQFGSQEEPPSAFLEAGYIKEVQAVNFMCHENLKAELSPFMNFIAGENGSGKSALLTAISFALGANAKQTNRSNDGAKGLIKSGKEAAMVELVIANKGSDAYKPELFGDAIIIERKITKTATLSIKDAKGKKIPGKPLEVLQGILDFFLMDVKNPLNVMTQDQTRTFLAQCDPKALFSFYAKGTLVEDMQNGLFEVTQILDSMDALIKDYEKDGPALQQDVEKLTEEVQQCQALRENKEQLDTLRKRYAWARVAAAEAQLAGVERRTGDLSGFLQKWEEGLRDYAEIEARGKEQEREVQAAVEAVMLESEPLKREIEEAKRALSRAQKAHGAARKELGEAEDDADRCKKEADRARQSKAAAERQLAADDELIMTQASEDVAGKQRALDAVVAEMRAAQEAEQAARAEHDRRAAEANDVGREINALRHQQQLLMSEKQQLAQAAADSLALLRPNMSRMVAEVQRRSREFSAPPVGPVGRFVRLNNPQFKLPVDEAIGRLLGDFIVNSNADALLIRKIAQDVQVTEGWFRMLECLVIDSDCVFNLLVDNANIEKLIICESDAVVRNIVWNGRCRNVKAGYITDGSVYTARNGSRNMMRRDSFYPPRIGVDIQQEQRRVEEALAEVNQRGQQAEAQRAALQPQQQEARAALEAARRKAQQLQKRRDECEYAVSESQRKSQQASRRAQPLSLDDFDRRIRDAESAAAEAEAAVPPLREAEAAAAAAVEAAQAAFASFGPRRDAIRERIAVHEAEKERILSERQQHEEGVKVLQQKIVRAKAGREKVEKLLEEAQAAVAETTRLALLHCTREEAEAIPVSARDAEKEAALSQADLLDKLEKTLSALKRSVEREEQRRGRSLEEIESDHSRAKKRLKTFHRNVEACRTPHKKLTTELRKSYKRVVQCRTDTQAAVSHLFNARLGARGHTGRLIVDYEDERLELVVQFSGRDGGKVEDLKSLSGGERSFVQLAYVLSLAEKAEGPFRAMDEWDVFMDAVNRKISFDTLLKFADQHKNVQFILLTPQDISAVKAENGVKILRMKAARQ